VRTVGYLPFGGGSHSVEAGWLSDHLSVKVCVPACVPGLSHGRLPALERLSSTARDLLALPDVVAEGPDGFLWAAILRAHGFAGAMTLLPYLNPHCWRDIAAIALYRRFPSREDRVFLGSSLSAAVYRAFGVEASVGEPFGIDDGLFGLRPGAGRARRGLSIDRGRVMLFAGRAQPDKDLYCVLRAGLRARVLFPDLQVVVASHVVDSAYLSAARRQLIDDGGVRFVVDPPRGVLADLYNLADVFVTASTSHYETFGRAPAEALACGSPVVAPRYDGFIDVLAQPGGTLVDVQFDSEAGGPRVDEDAMLRAVYEVLSAPERTDRRNLSITARQRFGRSTSIGMLAYLSGGASRPATAVIPPAAVDVPGEWRTPLAEIDGRAPMDALSWFWSECEHERFSAFDAGLVTAVRRSLCPPAPEDRERSTECP
jgi:glycosyltransferase involved in cell wall biosynthesis